MFIGCPAIRSERLPKPNLLWWARISSLTTRKLRTDLFLSEYKRRRRLEFRQLADFETWKASDPHNTILRAT